MASTPKNEFERLIDQDPALGVEFDLSRVARNLKARLPEASLSEGFPFASETEQPVKSLNAGSADSAATTPDSDEATQKRSEPATVPVASPAHGSALQEGTVIPMRRRGPAWGQIAASVAVTALLVGVGAATVVGGDGGLEKMLSGAAEVADGKVDAPEPTSSAELELSREDNAKPETSESTGFASETFRDTNRIRYSGQGLSTQRSSAPVYGFDESEAVLEETFEKLKSVLGMTAKTERNWGSFVAESVDEAEGIRQHLTMDGGGTGQFSWDARIFTLRDSEQDPDVAVRAAQSLMAELGKDPDLYDFTAENTEFWQWISDKEAEAFNKTAPRALHLEGRELTYKAVHVRAIPKSFGENVWNGMWDFRFVSDTPVGVQGGLADVVDLGTRELISPQEGIERLNDTGFGTFSMEHPEDWTWEQEVRNQSEPQKSDPPTATKMPGVGQAIEWEVADVVLKSAKLSYQDWEVDLAPVVVPVWEYSATNGATYRVLALADEELIFKP